MLTAYITADTCSRATDSVATSLALAGRGLFPFRLRQVVQRFDEFPDAFECSGRTGNVLDRVLQRDRDAAGERAAPFQRVLDRGESVRGLAGQAADRSEQALFLDVRLRAAEPEFDESRIAMARIQRGLHDAELPADLDVRQPDVLRGDLVVRLVREPLLGSDVGNDDIQDAVDLSEDELRVESRLSPRIDDVGLVWRVLRHGACSHLPSAAGGLSRIVTSPECRCRGNRFIDIGKDT